MVVKDVDSFMTCGAVLAQMPKDVCMYMQHISQTILKESEEVVNLILLKTSNCNFRNLVKSTNFKDHDECCSCFFTQGDLEWSKSMRNFPKVSLDTISKWLETGGKKNAGEKSYKAMCMMFTLRPLPRLNDYSCLGMKDIPSDATSTSRPQSWHIPRATSISPMSVMGTHYARAATDRSGERNRDPVKCKLYEARGPGLRQVDMQHVLSNVEIMRIKNKPPPFSYLLSDQEPTIKVNTVFGNVPLGSPLTYQLQDFGRPNTKFLFNRVRSEPLAATATHCTSFPDLPFFPNSQAVQRFDTNELRSITNLDFDTSRDFFQLNLSLDIAEAEALEKRTVLQGESKEWLEQHKIRLTASSFGKVFHRVHRPSEAMAKSLFANKDLSKVRAIAHGKAKERVARSIFARNMQKVTKTFTVFDAGLCVNPSLGASPDGKIYDPLADPCYGLLEIKCPFSKRADTLEQASADPTFYLEQIGESFYLKRGHSSGYYEQVQGQLAITGMKWCDFCVFLSETNEM
ncbi:hypothetical protein P5673_031011 [Acropora cervicornis]|uniref:YqaJ viral recombinase domain-containing protein n=1 Tax=Acropora cervicornis TaxID=6130 RepID=A0AAD9PTU1_ACRCE|nr:hypothetical protein P5673_031011 [Acropora cervicornis]